MALVINMNVPIGEALRRTLQKHGVKVSLPGVDSKGDSVDDSTNLQRAAEEFYTLCRAGVGSDR